MDREPAAVSHRYALIFAALIQVYDAALLRIKSHNTWCN